MSKIAEMQRRIRALESEVKRLNPVPSVGVLTSKTSRGVVRKATASATRQTTTTTIPRWG